MVLLVLSGLLFSITPPAQAAGKSRAASKASDADSVDIPPMSWGVTSKGFVVMFRHRKAELESTEPNRFFPGTVAFALESLDGSGHYLLLKCPGSDGTCLTKRDMLEERMVYATLLEVVRTKAPKALLYNASTWEVTSLGNRHLAELRKRYPDLNTRLGRLIVASFAGKGL